MMIPGQWEGRPRTAAAVEVPLSATLQAPLNGRVGDASTPRPRRELPAWLRVTSFAAILLAVSWLVMWLEAATR